MADFGGFEVINISKIRDGFFVGDANCSTNLEVILTYKISHIINSSPSQLMNAFESLGVKYLSINWSENINQNLFDGKDEISHRIVTFIDDCTNKGEGLLISSLKGKNRCCIVVLIYLMKKYRWSLEKSIEYLQSKKNDMDIMKQFLTQLSLFEARLNKIGARSTDWNSILKPYLGLNKYDTEEALMQNTFLNGISKKNVISQPNISKGFQFLTKKIKWADNGLNKNDILCNTNFSKDLFLQKTVRPITIHKNLQPSKPIIKGAKMDIGKSIKLDNLPEKKELRENDNIDKTRINNLMTGGNYLPRPQSSDNKKNNVQIITKNVNNFITNNINNIIISPNFKSYQEFLEESKQNNNVNQHLELSNNIPINPSSVGRPSSHRQKDYPGINDMINYPLKKGVNNLVPITSATPLSPNSYNRKSADLSNINDSNKKIKDNSISYVPSLPPTLPHGKNTSTYFNSIQMNSKKSNLLPSHFQNLVVRPTSTKQGPIKIQEINPKQSTTGLVTVKKNIPIQFNPIYKQNGNSYNNSQVRSNSLKERNNSNLRPSTAPSKNDMNSTSEMCIYPNSNKNSMKRLPSPNIKSSNYINNNNDISNNYGKIMMSSSGKYRSPSPMTLPNNGKNAITSYSGSFKGFSSKIMK